MTQTRDPVGGRWARLRFSIVGQLLMAPPPWGGLKPAIEALAGQEWQHPVSGERVRFGASTIERWYYAAQAADQDPVSALARRRRRDAGLQRTISPALSAAVEAQYKAHPSWSKQLHHDNLAARVEADPDLGPLPSYPTLARYMRTEGLVRQPRRRGPNAPRPRHEVRSYEVSRGHALWHADFHNCSRKVLAPSGLWVTPKLFAALDDHSRLACHAQWYLSESAQTYVHGLQQAFLKSGLPRAIMSDRGSAELAKEVQAGLSDLSILLCPTEACSPHQNGKSEVVWSLVEGQLMAMLEGVEGLTLSTLNDCTVAWFDRIYQRRHHQEIGCSPMERFLQSEDVSRRCPPMADLKAAFRIADTRRQRRSDGTISLQGVRFEVPDAWRHMPELRIRYARWDLSEVELVDDRGTGLATLRPLDKAANADRPRRRRGPAPTEDAPPAADGPSPLLRKLLADFAATGLPPAYLPLDEENPQ